MEASPPLPSRTINDSTGYKDATNARKQSLSAGKRKKASAFGNVCTSNTSSGYRCAISSYIRLTLLVSGGAPGTLWMLYIKPRVSPSTQAGVAVLFLPLGLKQPQPLLRLMRPLLVW